MKTKKGTLIFALLLVFIVSRAQKDFQGMALYESKTSTSDFKKRFEGNKEMTPEMQKMIEERMQKIFEKTFVLHFNKLTSTYNEEEKLEVPGQNGGGMKMMASIMGNGGTYFKDVKTKVYSVDKEFMGKEFLIKDSLVKYNWKMEGVSRQIGGYTCYKATALIPASKTDFRNFRPKREVENSAATLSEAPLKTQEKNEKGTSKTNFMEDIELPKELTITAWYSPEIPVSQGPEGYWGLPGLILEVNDGKTIILCSKIVLNPKEKTEIKATSNGKVLSQKEYDATVMTKMQEYRDLNRGDGHGGSNMRFGK